MSATLVEPLVPRAAPPAARGVIPGGRPLRVAWVTEPSGACPAISHERLLRAGVELVRVRLADPPGSDEPTSCALLAETEHARTLGRWLEGHDVDLVHAWIARPPGARHGGAWSSLVTVPEQTPRRRWASIPRRWLEVDDDAALIDDPSIWRFHYYRALARYHGHLPPVSAATLLEFAIHAGKEASDTGDASTLRSVTEVTPTAPAILTPPPASDDLAMDPADVTAIDQVWGHLHPWDAQALYRLARLSTGPIVELGSFLGRSTVSLLLGAAKSGQHVVAIDPWWPSDPRVLGFEHTLVSGLEDYLAFTRHVDAWRDRLLVHCCRSRDIAWQGPPIGALFIDAVHTYDEVSRDFRHYERWLSPGARVAFHDYLPHAPVFPGVKTFIETELLASGGWWWDDYRGGLLTLVRAGERPREAVLAHNARRLAAARTRVMALAEAAPAR